MTHIGFEVGRKYKNVKGMYEVLSIDKNTMRIRWDNGEEITTTVAFQKRVIQRMQRELEKPEAKRKVRRKKKS